MRTVICVHRCIICMCTNAEGSGYAKEHKLHTCDRCNLMQYCGRNHQRLDWEVHKKFCNAVAEIKKDLRIQHPLMLINGRGPKTKDEMSDAILRLKFLVRSKLNEPLSVVDTELTSFPAYCAVCFKFKPLKPCQHCHGVAYCSKQHRDQHAAVHEEHCASLDLLYSPHNIFVKPRDVLLNFSTLKFSGPVEDMDSTNLWDAFKNIQSLKLPDNPTATRQDFLLFSLVSDFSYIFNICYALTSARKAIPALAEAPMPTNYTIFVVGAKEERQIWFYIIQQRFFFTQFPNAKQLTLLFIGPEVTDTKKITNTITLQERECVVTMHGIKMLFEDFVEKDGKGLKPDLIMCFNCGFAEDSQIIDDCTSYRDVKNDEERGGEKKKAEGKNNAEEDGKGENDNESGNGENAKEAGNGENANEAGNGENAKEADNGENPKEADNGENAKEAGNGENAKGTGNGENANEAGNDEQVDQPIKTLWFKGLKALLGFKSCPIVFTSYTRKEGEYDLNVLSLVKQATLRQLKMTRFLYKSPNPYHDLRPIRMWTDQFDLEEIFYRNGHIQGVILHDNTQSD